MLHDLAKYSELFLRRLENKEKGLDHWSAGAYVALVRYRWKSLAAALAIQGHHIGLQSANLESLKHELNLEKLSREHPLNLRLTENDPEVLQQRFLDDGFSLPPTPAKSIYERQSLPVAGMLDVRMLFSALVDADYIETEAHFQGELDGTKHYREEGSFLKPDRAMELLCNYLNNLQRDSKADDRVNGIRNDLLKICLEAAEMPQGLFTLSAPTGAGKTLAMLAFALKHAQKHNNTVRRIVIGYPVPDHN